MRHPYIGWRWTELSSTEKLAKAQKDDPTLSYYRKQADKKKGPFRWSNGLLMRDARDDSNTQLIIVPQEYRQKVLELAHTAPGAGHFGRQKTWERLSSRMDWPGLRLDVKKTCESCPKSQKAKSTSTPRAPLQSLQIIETPFKRLAMDVFGPLKRTKRGNKYVLVIMDYATKWPEAFPLWNVEATTVVDCLLEVTARTGIPDEILTDNGTNFMSRVVNQYCTLTGIHQLKTSPYHPQTDGMVERFDSTIKRTLRKLQQKSSLRGMSVYHSYYGHIVELYTPLPDFHLVRCYMAGK